jgi:hypothetical protein
VFRNLPTCDTATKIDVGHQCAGGRVRHVEKFNRLFSRCRDLDFEPAIAQRIFNKGTVKLLVLDCENNY